MRPGCSDSSVPNCSAISERRVVREHDPARPEPDLRVWAATWAISTLVAEDAIVAMLWCSAYQTRRYPSCSARWASATLAAKLSLAVSPLRIGARSRIESGMPAPPPELGTFSATLPLLPALA